MFRPTTCLLVLSAMAASFSFVDDASACSPRRVVYYSQPTRVVHTVYSAPQPALTVVRVVEPKVTKVVRSVEVRPSLPEIAIGSEVTAAANFLGGDPGFVLIQMGGATLQCEIVDWSASSVTFKTPSLGLRNDASAKIELVRPDGRIVRAFDVRLTPPAELIVRTNADSQPNPAVALAAPQSAAAGGLSLLAPPAPGADIALTSN